MHRCPVCHQRVTGTRSCPRDGWTPTSTNAPPTGTHTVDPPDIMGFTIHKLLGAGGFSRVWAASRDADGVLAAIKVALARTTVHQGRFFQEAEALRSIGPPHVPKLFGSGCLEDGRPYLVMERIRGRTLAAFLASMRTPFALTSILHLMDGILVALQATHDQGIIHRDLKPENIFISRQRRVVLLDFGLAKFPVDTAPPSVSLDSQLTRTGMKLGTAEYMAPEQIENSTEIDVRADLYAAGAILFELLTLRPPFVGGAGVIEHAHFALRPPRPSEFAPVPRALEQLTLACLSKDPSRRPPSAAFVQRLLDEARIATSEDSLLRPPVSQGAPSSSASSGRTPQLISEARQLVVVLVVETPCPAMVVISAISECNGWVARHRGRRYLGVFTGKDADDPGQAALTAAREVLDRGGGRAVLFLASVVVRTQEHGHPTVYGAAVEHPDKWMPAEPWSGIMISGELAQVLPELATRKRPSAPPPPFVSALLGPASRDQLVGGQPPLIGRAPVVEALETSAAAAFDGTCPALFTLLGDLGSGKSRIAAETARIAKLVNPNALVISLQATQILQRSSGHEIADLMQALRDDEKTLESTAKLPGLSQVRDLADALCERAHRQPIAVILDDAHWADDTLVDALELATLDGSSCMLWVVVIANSQFDKLRPAWGKRTQRHHSISLPPLDEPAAMDFAAHLLLPAEYPPAETLKRLARWAAGNPACLTQLVGSLKEAGIVRRRAHAGTYYVATAELDKLPPSPAWQWLVSRQLDLLPTELASCVRLCSVLGTSFTRKELDEVQDALDRAGSAGTPVDAGYGLKVLVEQGLLVHLKDRYSFANAVFQEAVYDALDPQQRREIHRIAFEFWQEQAKLGELQRQDIECMARHAAACGEQKEAAQAFLYLGGTAALKHHYIDADQHYTAALGCSTDSNPIQRALSWMERGKCRYLLHRPREAVDDLANARQVAEQLQDDALRAEILLEQATALDWAYEFQSSAQCVEDARILIEQLDIEHLESRLLVARGRSCFRRAEIEQAIRLLETGALLAIHEGDYRTHLVALVMLAPALVMAGKLREAEIWFDEAIRIATEVQDWPHLCGVYLNRIPLWAMKKSLDQAREDMRRVLPLARQIGNPPLERTATLNAAELLHAHNERDEALILARRAHFLEQRFVERAVPVCSLLLARILAAGGDFDGASRLVGWVNTSCPPDISSPSKWSFFRMLQLILADLKITIGDPGCSPDSWDDVLAIAQPRLFPIELLELLYWRIKIAIQTQRLQEALTTFHQAEALLVECPGWRGRFEDLKASYDTCCLEASTEDFRQHPILCTNPRCQLIQHPNS